MGRIIGFACVILLLSACSATGSNSGTSDSSSETANSSSDLSSSLLSKLSESEGVEYENLCDEVADLCASTGASEGILGMFNDSDDSNDSSGTQIDADDDNAFDAIGVDTNGDGIYDFVIADLDGDGVFDSVFVRQTSDGSVNQSDYFSSDEADNDATEFPQGDWVYDLNSDGVQYGDEVWCGVNTLEDENGDDIISYEDTTDLFDGRIETGTKCNDPDWFCSVSIFDRRCLDADIRQCAIRPDGPVCGSEEAIEMYGPYEGGAE